MKPLIRTNVFLSARQRAELKKIGKKRGVSAATVLRDLIDGALGTGKAN